MVLVYSVVALVGGLISCAVLWPYGAAVALLSMPFCGSLLALIAAFLVYMRALDETSSSHDPAVYIDQPRELQATESR